MLHDEAMEDLPGDGLVLVVELTDGLESELQIIGGSALAVIEDEKVGGNMEREGDLAQDVERGLGVAGLVALDLREMDAGRLGHLGLGEVEGAPQGGQPVCEAHCYHPAPIAVHEPVLPGCGWLDSIVLI
jgi:hypothetical protein